jgi:hypothetical protein
MATSQNTSVVIRDTTIGTSINPAIVDKLWQVSKVTGFPLSWMLNHALEFFMEVEAPVYMEHYTKLGQGQQS